MTRSAPIERPTEIHRGLPRVTPQASVVVVITRDDADKIMRVAIKRISLLFCGVPCLMSLWSVSAFGAERPLAHPTGLVVSTLPPFYTTVWIGGVPYYYANDVYYRWVPEQNGYEVVEPPQDADQPDSIPLNSMGEYLPATRPPNANSTGVL